MTIEISRVYTRELLALCYVFDKYEEFLNELKDLLSKSKKEVDTIYNLEQLSHGKFGIYSKSLKEFYEKHKELIDEVNKYSHIHTFICQAHTWNEETSIYYYLKSHKEEMQNIIKILEKLISLRIYEIEFSEKFDFDKNYNEIYTNLSKNSYVHFYDNMEVIPTYGEKIIAYKTNGSPYDIELKVEPDGVEFCTIQLNSLDFNPNRLPMNITKENTIDEIIALKESKQTEYDLIKKLIDLRIANHEAVMSFTKLQLEMTKLETSERKEDFLESMKKIRNQLEQIIESNKKYEIEVLSSSEYVTQEVLDKEEKKYQRKKYQRKK